MHRFYVTFPMDIDMVVTDQDLCHQIMHVLRMRLGDEIVLFSQEGIERVYEIVKLDKKSLSIRGIRESYPKTEPKKSITLYQALPNKYEKIEYILQKGVEVGIKRFVFFRSDYSQKLIISEAKKQRFLNIVKEAVEQCHGMILPNIDYFEEMPPYTNQEAHLYLDTSGTHTSITQFGRYQDIGVWVGPEGGWSPEERKKMGDYGFISAHFGERVLRTETAGIVVSFALINV